MKNISKKYLNALYKELDEESVIITPEELEDYSHDETPELIAMPECVVIPKNSHQVEKIVRLSYEHGIAITPRGAGTGVAGGAIPVAGGIVLSLERLDKILEIDNKNLVAVVQPGVITGNLQRAVEEFGLYYPVDPASVDSCSIGGNIATCAGGMRAFKYGTTKKFVQGIEVIFPPGDNVRLGGKMIKDVAGYDLMGILIGSEGTLGVVTETILQLLPYPKFNIDLLAGFNSIQEAAEASLSIVPETGVYPAAMEIWEREITKMSECYLEKKLPFSDAAGQIIISIEGFDESQVKQDYMCIGEHLLSKGALDVLVASSRFESNKFWEARKSLRDAVRHRSPIIAAEDLAVPPSRTPELLAGAKKIGKKHAATIIGFGHIGDGNLHIDLLRDKMTDKQWAEAKGKIVPELLALAIELDGTITGEHGIGYIKRKYLHLGDKKFVIERMRAIKNAIDPQGLMNPQKVFPD